MKKFWLVILSFLLLSRGAFAENNDKLIKKINYLNEVVEIVGLPDFPPFSYYDTSGSYPKLSGAFIKPILKLLKEREIQCKPSEIHELRNIGVKLLLIDVKSGKYQMFIGANSDTKLYKGLELIYPSIISNPIHLITLPDNSSKFKNFDDLKNYKGIACREEYFSDFVLRKLKNMNVTFVDSSYEAYRLLFTGEADYMLGSLYYNRIAASKYGIEKYLSFSKRPIWKIPVFIALSKVMPKLSEYTKVFQELFSSPEFTLAVKQEIIRIIEDEIARNDGIVPPSFAKTPTEDKQPQEEVEQINNSVENKSKSGHIIEKEEVQQKTFDEVLEGL